MTVVLNAPENIFLVVGDIDFDDDFRNLGEVTPTLECGRRPWSASQHWNNE